MWKNYFKIAWRNQIKNKSQSFINIGGMVVGMAVAMLIGLWIWDELSFNKHHEHYDRIVFKAAGAAALLIAICTVSYQAVKAATANPVKNLRTE